MEEISKKVSHKRNQLDILAIDNVIIKIKNTVDGKSK